MSPLNLQLYSWLSCLKQAQKLKHSHIFAGWNTPEYLGTFLRDLLLQAGVKAPAEEMISPHDLTGCPIDSEKILPHDFSTVMWTLSALLKCLL